MHKIKAWSLQITFKKHLIIAFIHKSIIFNKFNKIITIRQKILNNRKIFQKNNIFKDTWTS